MKTILDYAELIHARGHRLTPQRALIFDTLVTAGGHLTAMELSELVLQSAPTINRATVYRTLDFLCKMQLVTSTEIERQTVYEVTEETPHHHLVCRGCGNTQELDHEHFQLLAEHLRREHQFEPEINHLTITGLCAGCQEERWHRLTNDGIS